MINSIISNYASGFGSNSISLYKRKKGKKVRKEQNYVCFHKFLLVISIMICDNNFDCRRYVSVGVIGCYIIAAGGYDGNQHLDSCEVFDPNTNIWTKKSPMKTQRSSAGGCVLNELFYISG